MGLIDVVNQNAINELENLNPNEDPDNKENDCSKCKQVQRIEERHKYLRSVCIGQCVLIIALIIALVVVVYQHGATTNLTINSTPVPKRPEPTTVYPKSDLGVSSDLDPPGVQVNLDQNTGMIIGASIGLEEDIILRCMFPFKLNQRNLGGNVYWWHDGEEISSKHELVTIRVDMEFGYSIFAKGNATVADSGKYTCQWRLRNGIADSASFYINVG